MANELQDDLDAYVLGDDELEPEGDEAIEPPADADRANVLMRVMRGLDRELRRIDMLANQEISRIESWRADRSAGLVRRRAAIEKVLEQWMRAVNRVTPKRKSESLPNGKLALRAGKRSTQIVDAEKFLAWWRNEVTMSVAKELHDLGVTDADTFAPELVEIVLSRSPLVKIKPEPSKTGIAEAGAVGEQLDSDDESVVLSAVVIDGEKIPGVAFAVPAADTFSVQVS